MKKTTVFCALLLSLAHHQALAATLSTSGTGTTSSPAAASNVSYLTSQTQPQKLYAPGGGNTNRNLFTTRTSTSSNITVHRAVVSDANTNFSLNRSPVKYQANTTVWTNDIKATPPTANKLITTTTSQGCMIKPGKKTC